METCTEQEITKKDLQAIIEESNRHRRWEYAYKMAKIIITPLIITIVSLYVTWRINIQQAENTRRMNEFEIRSANIIAEANREHTKKLSESQQRIERLDHIKDIFRTFLSNDQLSEDFSRTKEKQKFEAAKMQIISLEVYKEDALLFLLNIRDHYENKLKDENINEIQKNYIALLVNQTERSIENILMQSQINLSERVFMNCARPESRKAIEYALKDNGNRPILRRSIINLHAMTKEPAKMTGNDYLKVIRDSDFRQINLRRQEYKNYDFTNCSFISANLYSSDFSNCTLYNNLFINVDLQEATFSNSNLTGSIFYGSNLKKGNFKDSMLKNVVFINPVRRLRDSGQAIQKFCSENSCCELDGAQFTLGSLLKTKTSPFNVFDRENNSHVFRELREEWKDLYTNLLVHHLGPIEYMQEAAEKGDKNEEDKLKILMKNTDVKSATKLVQLLKNAAEKEKMLAAHFVLDNKPALAEKK